MYIHSDPYFLLSRFSNLKLFEFKQNFADLPQKNMYIHWALDLLLSYFQILNYLNSNKKLDDLSKQMMYILRTI